MSQENVELVRSIFAAWERGDWSSAEWAHPEIRYAHIDGPAPGSWMGLAGMVDAFRGVLNAWSDFSLKLEECRELDDKRVLVVAQLGGRGKTSGLELDRLHTKCGYLFHIRDARVVRLAIYWDRDRALADLGLAPEGESPRS